jgi:oligopeptide/dipeptide ABC transporter ATP-binding protein
MRQRVVIAIALAANPGLIIADEPTTALDVTVQAQILTLMENLVKKFGSSLILITHDLAVVSEMTHRVAVMYCGRIVEEGPTKELIRAPYHPYTMGLLESIPRMAGTRLPRLPQIPGMVPSLFDLPRGCSFEPRCPRATARCREEIPEMRRMTGNRRTACHNPQTAGKEAADYDR